MENLVVYAKKKINIEKFDTAAKITAASDIKSILTVTARSVITTVEQVNTALTIGGKVVVTAIYLTGENEISSAETVVDFTQKQVLKTALKDIVASDEVFVKVDAISGTEILCSVTHNTHIFGIYEHKIADFVGENTALVLNNKAFNSLKFVDSPAESFVVAEEVESNISATQILAANAVVIDSTIAAAAEKVVIQGKVLVSAIYKDGESIQELSKQFEFKQEIASTAVVPNMIAESNISVKSVTVTAEEKEGKTNLIYAIELFAKPYVYEEETYVVASDMFSLESDIENIYDFLELKNYKSTETVSDVLVSSTDISNIENLDDILGVYSISATADNIIKNGDSGIIEGNFLAVAIYKSNDEVKKLDIKTAIKVEFAPQGDDFEIDSLSAEISSFKVKAGRELEIAIKLYAEVSNYEILSASYVKSFEIKGEKPKNNGGIKVYVASSGETVFDIAKTLSVRPEIIEEQNEIDSVFEQGQKIFVYSPINLL